MITHGAGSWRSLEQVENGKEEDPDQIDEVPEQSGVFHPVGEVLGIGLPELGARSPEAAVYHDAADHGQHMEAGEREVDRQEGVLARQQAVMELGRVLDVLDAQEAEAGED